MQTCTSCNELKPLIAFEHRKDRPNPRKMCKSCRNLTRDKEKERLRHREYMKERRAKEPEVLRQNWERCVYGKSKEDLGITSCQICGSVQRLSIDHCHASKHIRGILCSKCNTGLGLFRDNPDFLLGAINYLKTFKDGVHFQLKDE